MPSSLPLFFYLLIECFARAGSLHAQVPLHTVLETKNVLILHSHEANAPVFTETDRGLSDTLQRGGVPAANQFFESLDLRRNPGAEYRKFLVEEMRLRYGRQKIDLIVTMFPEALQFLLEDARDIFPGVPVLALYLPQNAVPPRTDRPIITHSAVPDISGTLALSLKLMPEARHVYVVSGTHPIDRGIEDLARRIFLDWGARLEFRYLTNLPFKEVLRTLSTTPPDSVVLLLVFTQDIAGRNFTARDLTDRLSRVAAAPIFGLLDVALGYGITGGSLINFGRIGERAGELAIDLLKGNPVAESGAASLDVPPVPMFDWRQLTKWKIGESDLPRGSIVINRDTTLWDYKSYWIGGLAFIMVQFVLIICLWSQQRRRKSAENSLSRKTAELENFFGVTLDLVCICDREGYFLHLNPAWERVLGYATEELVRKMFFEFVHPEDMRATEQAFSKVLSRLEIFSFENRYRCRDGSYRWLEWSAAADGNLIYAAARDITDRLNAEAEARQRRVELAKTSRLTMIGKFTTTLAHEISQPLTGILSNAEAARRFIGGSSPDIIEVLKILDDIIRDDRRAVEVVRKVRTLVRKENPQQDWVDLNQEIGEVITLMRGESLLDGLSISMELDPELRRIHGDRTLLQQVMINLILNSAGAMKDSPASQRKIIVKTAMKDGDTVEACVEDFGTGIDETIRRRLFEPFCTTKPEGLGMGLFICNEIVKDHGGSMEASNNPDGGATFCFTLPARRGGSVYVRGKISGIHSG